MLAFAPGVPSFNSPTLGLRPCPLVLDRSLREASSDVDPWWTPGPGLVAVVFP